MTKFDWEKINSNYFALFYFKKTSAKNVKNSHFLLMIILRTLFEELFVGCVNVGLNVVSAEVFGVKVKGD